VILAISAAVSSLVLLPFLLISLAWISVYDFFAGGVPGISFNLPGNLSLPGGAGSISIPEIALPLPPQWLSVLEMSSISIAAIIVVLVLLNSLTPMRKRIKNASGFNAQKVPRDAFPCQVVADLRNSAGGPRCSVWLIPVEGIKAFALSGPLIGHGIVISEGIINKLPKEMVAWIIAHEFGHIRHGDTRSSSFWLLSMRSVYFLERFRILLMNLLLKITKSLPVMRAFTLPVFMIFRLLVWIGRISISIGKLIFLVFDRWASRKMEYAADRYAALMIGPEEGAQLFEGLMGDIEPLFNGLFATHPPLAKRAEKLRSMNTKSGPDYSRAAFK
jgi:Zn-dependent protease with chaperone function